MQHYQTARKTDAPRADAWAVLSDHSGWGDHAPNLSKSEVVAGSGEGAVRRCYNSAGQGWSETCTLWQPGTRYVMEVDTSDYPYPLSVMRGTFDVNDAGNGSIIRLRFDYKVKGGPAGRVPRNREIVPVLELLGEPPDERVITHGDSCRR